MWLPVIFFISNSSILPDNRPITSIGLPLNPKIIVITDGHVTDIRLQNGPDTTDPEEDEKVSTFECFLLFLFFGFVDDSFYDCEAKM